MAEKTQSFANHARLDPLFHLFLLPVAGVTIVLTVYRLVRHVNFASAWNVVLAIAFAVAVFKIRTYALKVQDRVIRLEERLRLSGVLPEPLRSRIPELTEAQLIAIRFAPDSECTELVERVLTTQPKQAEIKKTIRNWRPDYFRV